MRFVENEQRAGERRFLVHPRTQWGGVRLIAQQRVGNDEAVVGLPWVNPVAALSATFEHVVAIEDDHRETEALSKLFAPLSDN